MIQAGMTPFTRIASSINSDLLVVMFSVACGMISLVFAGYAHAEPVAGPQVSTGETTFPGEIYAAPKRRTERSLSQTALLQPAAKKGGHFAAREQRQLFSEEI